VSGPCSAGGLLLSASRGAGSARGLLLSLGHWQEILELVSLDGYGGFQYRAMRGAQRRFQGFWLIGVVVVRRTLSRRACCRAALSEIRWIVCAV